jgi:hypothetical protein
MGSITVYFKPLDYAGDDTYKHEYIVWTSDNGDQFFLRGGPTHFGPSNNDGGGSGSSGVGIGGGGVDLPFRSVRVDYGPYNANTTRDYVKPGTEPGQVIITGSDKVLSGYYAAMVAEGNKINQQNIGYAFGGPNSNTVATSLLQAAGLPQPKGNGLNGPDPAPGADMSFITGQYNAETGYLELGENALNRGGDDIENFLKRGGTDIVAHLRTLAKQARAEARSKPVSDAMKIYERVQAMIRNQQKYPYAPMPRSIGPRSKSSPNATHEAAAGVDMAPWRQALKVPEALLRFHKMVQDAAARLPAYAKATDLVANKSLKYLNVISTIPSIAPRGHHSSIDLPHKNDFDHPAMEPPQMLRNTAAAHNLLARNRFGPALPSQAPIRQRTYPEATLHRQLANPRVNSGAEQTSTAPLQQNSYHTMNDLDFEERVKQAMERIFNREARLPPRGATGFDPYLSPAWPGRKLPN